MEKEIQIYGKHIKGVFAQGVCGVNETSSWLDIVKAHHFDGKKIKKLYWDAGMDYSKTIGCNTVLEVLAVRPYQKELLKLVADSSILDFGDVWMGLLDDGVSKVVIKHYPTCKMRQEYPDEMREMINFYDVTIVTPNCPQYRGEYFSLEARSRNYRQQAICIKYTDKMPENIFE